MAAKRDIDRIHEAREAIRKGWESEDWFFTTEQVEDICGLIRRHQWPDSQYGDAECNLWSIMCKALGEKPLEW